MNAVSNNLGRLAAVILLGGMVSAAHAGALESRIAVEAAMRRANDYFQASISLGNSGWERSTYQTGNFRAWETLGIQAYYDRAATWGEANSWWHGTDYGDVNGLSADAHCCGQTYIDLYHVDPQPVRTNNITALLDDILLENRPDSIDDWWWIDAFYMAGSTLARLGVLNSDTNYLNQLRDMYDYMKYTQGGGLFNPSQGLWWRDSGYKSSAPDTYWGRGNGWVIASLARNLEVLPSDDTICRPEFESMLQAMAAALLPWQQDDGFWRADITNPTNAYCPNPETSGTAFFTYAIAYGLNEGILVDAPGTNYTAAVTKAWNGLVSIALHPNGKLGYTQAVGSNPQPANYDSERDYGCGAFLLAGSEILRLLGGPIPVYPNAGPDLVLSDADDDFAEPVTLSASNTMLRSGTIEGYSWWSGPVLLGTGPELGLIAPLGTNTITLAIEHSDGNTYTGNVAVAVSPPGLIATASGYEAGTQNTPDKTLDGDLGTRWSQNGDGGTEWIQYELPLMTVIDHIDIAFYNGDSRVAFFDVRISTTGMDPGDFTTVTAPTNSSGATLALQTFSFPAQPAKYIRIYGYGNSVSTWNSFTEVAISIPQAADQDDIDGNGLPDSWEIHFFGATGQVPATEIGSTGITLGEAYVLGLDPVTPDATPLIEINVVSNQTVLALNPIGAFGVGYQGLTRKYHVSTKTVLTNATWTALPGYESYTGNNIPIEIGIKYGAPISFYAMQTWLE